MKKYMIVLSILFTLLLNTPGAVCEAAEEQPNRLPVGQPAYAASAVPGDGSVIAGRCPIMQWSVYPNGNSISRFSMTLNGKAVPVVRKTGPDGVTWEYRPEVALPPGQYVLVCEVTFHDYRPVAVTSRFTITANPLNPFEGRNKEHLALLETEAVRHLNLVRKALGITGVVRREALTKSAQSHSNFLTLNHVAGHYQNKNYAGFTGETVQDRAVFFGYNGAAGEGIDYGTAEPRISVEALLDAPYHRLGLIDPNNRDAGAGFSITPYHMVINFGTTGQRNDDRVMLYPYAGQSDAKLAWYAAESPNPLAYYRKERSYVGYPVSLSVHDAATQELKVVSACLKDGKGNDVPHYLIDAKSAEEAKKCIILIPQASLEPGMTYSVQIEAKRVLTDGTVKPLQANWSFTTRKTAEIDYIGMIRLGEIENLEVKLNSGSMSDMEYVLIHCGQIIRKYQADRGYTWNSKHVLPDGLYRLQVVTRLSPVLMEYTVKIAADGNAKTVSIIGEKTLGNVPPLRAGIMLLGGREYIELIFKDAKPADLRATLKRDGEIWRTYSAADNMHYAFRKLELPEGEYQLELTSAAAGPVRYTLSIGGKGEDRQVTLTPATR